MEPDDLLCSRNARSKTPLVGRAHDGKPPGHPLGEERRALRWRTFPIPLLLSVLQMGLKRNGFE